MGFMDRKKSLVCNYLFKFVFTVTFMSCSICSFLWKYILLFICCLSWETLLCTFGHTLFQLYTISIYMYFMSLCICLNV